MRWTSHARVNVCVCVFLQTANDWYSSLINNFPIVLILYVCHSITIIQSCSSSAQKQRIKHKADVSQLSFRLTKQMSDECASSSSSDWRLWDSEICAVGSGRVQDCTDVCSSDAVVLTGPVDRVGVSSGTVAWETISWVTDADGMCDGGVVSGWRLTVTSVSGAGVGTSTLRTTNKRSKCDSKTCPLTGERFQRPLRTFWF